MTLLAMSSAPATGVVPYYLVNCASRYPLGRLAVPPSAGSVYWLLHRLTERRGAGARETFAV